MRTGAALLLVLAAFASVSHAGVNSWTIKGPPGGPFRQVEASTTAPNVFYAIYNRSVHRSTDGGITWTTLRAFESQVNSIAVDPADGNRFYVTVIEHGLFRSEDAGQSFTAVAPGDGLWGVGANATAVYYATNARRFYRSTDRGQTWTERTPPPQVLTKIIVDRQDANLIYAHIGPYLIRSTDGGGSWSQFSIGLSGYNSAYDVAQLSATHLLAASNNGLFLSSDSGASWTLALAGSHRAIAVDRSAPGRAIVASVGSQVWLRRTSDYGASWNSLGSVLAQQVEGIAIDSQSATRIVALSQQIASRTGNDGQTWTQATQQPIASSPEQMATSLASDSKVYTYTTGGGGGLFASSRDSQWQRLNLDGAQAGQEFGQATLAVKPGAPNSLYLAAVGRGVYRSNDGGNTWLAPGGELFGSRVGPLAFDVTDSDIVYASVNTFVGTPPVQGLYRSVDGGASWSAYSTNLPVNVFGWDLQVDPADGSRMYLAALDFGASPHAGLWRSNDRGITWTQAAFIGQNTRAIAINPASTSRMYVATGSGLHVSGNGGDTFERNNQFAIVTGSRPAVSVAIDPTVPNTIYALSAAVNAPFGTAVTSSAHVLRSVDDGQTWEILRDANASPTWSAGQVMLDPNVPSLIYVNTGTRGIAAMEIAPDLSLQLSGHSGMRAQNVAATFDLRAINNGPYAATAVRITANLPAGLTGVAATTDRGSCAVGATVTCDIAVLRVGEEINVVVSYTPPGVMYLPVAATVVAHENDAAAADNVAEAAASTTDRIVELGVTVQPSATSVTPGSNVTYAVSVSNAGPVTSEAGTLEFTLGSGFTPGAAPPGCSSNGSTFACSLGTIAVGASQSFSFPAVATQAATVTATVTVRPAESAADRNNANNTATVSVTAADPPPPPSNGGGGGANGSGGGGGGALNLAALVAMLALLVLRRGPAWSAHMTTGNRKWLMTKPTAQPRKPSARIAGSRELRLANLMATK
jgi:uncharacterized repeat protein (TIGR01451 family)